MNQHKLVTEITSTMSPPDQNDPEENLKNIDFFLSDDVCFNKKQPSLTRRLTTLE